MKYFIVETRRWKCRYIILLSFCMVLKIFIKDFKTIKPLLKSLYWRIEKVKNSESSNAYSQFTLKVFAAAVL